LCHPTLLLFLRLLMRIKQIKLWIDEFKWQHKCNWILANTFSIHCEFSSRTDLHPFKINSRTTLETEVGALWRRKGEISAARSGFQAGHAPTVRQASALSIVCATGVTGDSKRPSRERVRARGETSVALCERALTRAPVCVSRVGLLRLGNPTYMRLRRANSTAGAPVKGISQCVVWAESLKGD